MNSKQFMWPLLLGVIVGAFSVGGAWAVSHSDPAPTPSVSTDPRLLRAEVDDLNKYVRLHGKALDGLLNHVEALEQRRELLPHEGKSIAELRAMLHPRD
jgi:hypothetical protein